MGLIGEGRLRNKDKPEGVKAASDFSYSAPSYAGPHYRIAGDAGGAQTRKQVIRSITLNV